MIGLRKSRNKRYVLNYDRISYALYGNYTFGVYEIRYTERGGLDIYRCCFTIMYLVLHSSLFDIRTRLDASHPSQTKSGAT